MTTIRLTATKPTLIIQFVLLSTVIASVTIEGKNILFIAFSILGAVALLVLNRKFPLKVSKVIFLNLLLLIVSFAINFRRADHLSFLYSLFFVCAFVVFASYFKAKLSIDTFRAVAFGVLILYLILLIVGQVYVLLGLFKGTSISTGLVHGPFGTLFEAGYGFRFYSLSSEPSYAAFIVLCLLYAILETDPYKKPFGKINAYAWLITVYMLLSFQSGYGVLLFFVLVLFKTTYRNAIIILGVAVFVLIGGALTKQTAATRVVNLLSNIDFNRLEKLATVDHSASFRILPTYYYIKNIDVRDPHFYLGYGAGQSSEFLIPFLFDSKVESYEGGFMPQFLYDYGIIFAFVFVVFLRKETICRIVSFETFVIALMMTNANFNTQLFWIVITIFSLTKFYKRDGDGSHLPSRTNHALVER